MASLAAISCNAQTSVDAGENGAQDPCAVLSYNGTVMANEVLACYASFQLSDSLRTEQIAAARSYLHLYPYLEIVKANGFDLLSSLSSLQNDTSIITEYALQSRITLLFNRLMDAHTVYNAVCFNVNQFIQPWVIAANYPLGGGKPVLYLRDTIAQGSTFGEDFAAVYPDRLDLGNRFLDVWARVIGRDPSTLVGYEIVSVDGMDPVESVQAYADKYVGLSHVPETRFNYALASSHYFRGKLEVQDGPYFSTSMFTDDMHVSRTYVLRQPGSISPNSTITLEVPWMAFLAVKSSRPISSTRYYNALCTTSNTPVASASKAGTLRSSASIVAHSGFASNDDGKPRVYRGRVHNAVDLASFWFKYARLMDGLELKTTSASKGAVHTLPPSQPVASDKGAAFYLLRGNKTAVMAIPGFEPGLAPNEDMTQESIIRWLETIGTGLRRVQDAGAENLVLDMTGNGGGVILRCQMTRENRWLLQNANGYLDDMNAFVLDGQVVPVGGASSVDATAGVLRGERRVVREWNRPGNDGRARVDESVSGRFSIDCTGFDGMMARLPKLTKPFDPAKVVVLSNGFCGSTCAESVRSLRRQFGVKTFVFGGGRVTPRAFQPTAFEGGSVLQYSQVLLSTEGIVTAAMARPRVAPDGDQVEEGSPTVGLELPRAFPQPVVGQILHWQSYTDFINTTLTTVCRRVEWDPADYYLPVEDPTDIVRVWQGVAASIGDEVGAAGAPKAFVTWTAVRHGNGGVYGHGSRRF
ncbi:hypothetical protein BC829DRAFT_420762 [Chytridium lagenaria]|nr:hypothetical protein BC829DRAFT_420762 [Chytridium lagenaria]